jgi:methylmalonyl-CoA epimerase
MSTSARVTGLAHVAIATPDADALADMLVAALGATRRSEELLDNGSLRVVFVQLGPVTLELLQPRGADHTVAKFLARRGPGLHHVSLEVSDIGVALADAKRNGAGLIDEVPRHGAHGAQVAFLHPRTLGGVLVELCQAASPEKETHGG